MIGKRRTVCLIAVAVAMLTIASAAYAITVSIDTNNGVLDTAWPLTPLVTDPNTNDTNWDIVAAWMGNEADSSAYYFRVQLDETGQSPYDFDIFEARLDCNDNLSFQDSVDVVVMFVLDFNLPGEEMVVECQGNAYAGGCSTVVDYNDDTFGEEVLGDETPIPLWNYEWKADTSAAGNVDWSACLGTVNVQFASFDGTPSLKDTTAWVVYQGAPTAVSLATFTATAEDRKVLLNWETASELDIMGFNLYRAEVVDGQQAQLNADLIPGQMPGSPSGAAYEHMDETVQPGATYWYWLEGVDAQGAPTRHGPVSATVPLVEVSHSIYLPLVHK